MVLDMNKNRVMIDSETEEKVSLIELTPPSRKLRKAVLSHDGKEDCTAGLKSLKAYDAHMKSLDQSIRKGVKDLVKETNRLKTKVERERQKAAKAAARKKAKEAKDACVGPQEELDGEAKNGVAAWTLYETFCTFETMCLNDMEEVTLKDEPEWSPKVDKCSILHGDSDAIQIPQLEDFELCRVGSWKLDFIDWEAVCQHKEMQHALLSLQWAQQQYLKEPAHRTKSVDRRGSVRALFLQVVSQ